MALLQFLIAIFGATMLLLFAVRMVQNGIERMKGPEFKRILTNAKNPYRAAMAGAAMAILLQSSAAVAILTAGFSTGGMLAIATGLAIILGADVGSAIVVQVLSLDLSWLAPVLMGIGAWLYLKFNSRNVRQTGRIMLGISLIIVALGFLRDAVAPIKESDFLPMFEAFLAADPVLAFMVGVVLAFVMHSSVAAVLMIAVVAGAEAISVPVGILLILGANLGGALVPVWITRNMSIEARRPVVANVALRGITAAIVAALYAGQLIDDWVHMLPNLVLVHFAFNLVLLLYLPFTPWIGRLVKRAMVNGNGDKVTPMAERSLLDESALDSVPLSLSSLRREVVRMTNISEQMIREVLGWYLHHKLPNFDQLDRETQVLHDAGQAVRHYVTRMPSKDMTKAQFRRLRDLADYALSIDASTAILSQRLETVIKAQQARNLYFSESGAAELRTIAEQVLHNMANAYELLVSEDIEIAREIFRDKDELGMLVAKSRKKHLLRLREGLEKSIATSEQHLESLAALKELNAQIVSIAYPILKREGQLLQTRLILDGKGQEL
ncbi:Na/Pi cotransporter family protein [Maritalea mediterranea]|uniref:Na/Pi cotransporter family protein n=1 Tax=Maritalea mediterranea TaxID=2909667 RepID=A0ABS9E8U2_9HYPH|nr:Na/Pi cotransporter family protein [Maritalea mediterranea]MCF4099305.1 Na/Pi cotransporter family protein [Maritalea mediterranea]